VKFSEVRAVSTFERSYSYTYNKGVLRRRNRRMPL